MLTKLAELERRAAPAEKKPAAQRGPALAPAGADESFDIARELAEELGPAPAAGPAEDEFQYSVEDVFNQFKKGVEQTVKKEDSATHYDLGIAHWLALVQAATRASIVLLVYPATAAFGMVLLASLVWLVARQLLRLGWLAAGASALLFATVPHPLYWGHHNGFLQQTYALPLLLFALVLTARVGSPARWNAAMAALFAVPVAFLVAVYLPLVPTLVVGVAVGVSPALARARRRGRLGRFAGFGAWTALFLLLLAGRDVVGAIAPLHGFAASVAGGHIPLDVLQFFQFALGTRTPAPGWTNVDVALWSALNRVLAPASAARYRSATEFVNLNSHEQPAREFVSLTSHRRRARPCGGGRRKTSTSQRLLGRY